MHMAVLAAKASGWPRTSCPPRLLLAGRWDRWVSEPPGLVNPLRSPRHNAKDLSAVTRQCSLVPDSLPRVDNKHGLCPALPGRRRRRSSWTSSGGIGEEIHDQVRFGNSGRGGEVTVQQGSCFSGRAESMEFTELLGCTTVCIASGVLSDVLMRLIAMSESARG
jgi:hypothetical protein